MANFLISRTDTHIERWNSRFEGKRKRALMTWACRMPRKFSLIFQMLRPTPSFSAFTWMLHGTPLSQTRKKRRNEQTNKVRQSIHFLSIMQWLSCVCACVCTWNTRNEDENILFVHIALSRPDNSIRLMWCCSEMYIHKVCGMCINQINYLCFWINPQLINKVEVKWMRVGK